MSLECGECERDLRGPHDPSCSRYISERELELRGLVDELRDALCDATHGNSYRGLKARAAKALERKKR